MTKEQEAHWTPNGMHFDPQKLSVECGPADEWGNRLVVASLYGEKHRDTFNTDNAYRRKAFRETCFSRFGVEDESIHEAIETAIIAKADAADTRVQSEPLFKPVITMLDTVMTHQSSNMKPEHKTLLSACLARHEALAATATPPEWRRHARRLYDEQREHGPAYSPAEWFGAIPNHERQRMLRAIADLERNGLVVTHRKYERRLSHLKLTDAGRELAITLRASTDG